ncbi:AraC family transcriptional regulator [Mucilaginibacter gynuensis]|uniref:AraC family transcriptional regulator n=1 Tax=Mucilaginibacter gynuensis TaxID=1302236 RepID=A0ABP8HES4_9SPHI
MKASYELIKHNDKQSFLARTFDAEGFNAPYHYHREYELTYIVSGTGKRYVGSHMENFGPGDLVLLGPNVPHCWKLEDKQDDACSIVIQFVPEFLGDDFFTRHELRHISRLLQKSGNGICFKSVNADMKVIMQQFTGNSESFKKLLLLLDALQTLAKSRNQVLLDQHGILPGISMSEQPRINPVFAYLVENFRCHVSLEEAAGIANMTPNAFCKYFKRVTRRTFMDTIIEYRLSYATQLLVQTDKPISAIAFDCGFGDVSHFYKTFKARMQVSPLNYRKKFLE